MLVVLHEDRDGVAFSQPLLPEVVGQPVGAGLQFVEGDDGPCRMQDDGRFARADVVANLHEQTLRRPNLTGVKWSFSGPVAMSKPIL